MLLKQSFIFVSVSYHCIPNHPQMYGSSQQKLIISQSSGVISVSRLTEATRAGAQVGSLMHLQSTEKSAEDWRV